MAKVSRYFMKNNTSGLAKFNIDYSDAVLDNQTIYINGTNKVDSVYIGVENQVTFDFTQSGNGKDNLYLVSNLANYKLYKATTLTADDTLVLNIGSTVIKANQADKLIFADGSVNVSVLMSSISANNAQNAVTLSNENLFGWNNLLTSSSILPTADSSSAELSGYVQAGRNDPGITFATTRKSAMVLRGSAGVDVVYVGADTQVDATDLADGEDKIYLSKPASDYTISAAGKVMRLQSGNESITVLKGDRLYFLNDSQNISVASLLEQIPTGSSLTGVPLASATSTTNMAPSVSIDVSDRTLIAGERATVNLTFSENVSGFDSSDISVTGGTISGLSKLSDKIYQATYTPNDNSNVAGSLSIAANKFSDLANLSNSASTSTSFTINTIRPTVELRLNVVPV